MEAALVESSCQLVPPSQQLLFVFVVPQRYPALEFLKLQPQWPPQFLLLILLPQQFEYDIKGEPDAQGLFLAGLLDGSWSTLSLTTMQFS